MSDYALLIDYKYCTGCHVCEVSCRKEHDIPLGRMGHQAQRDGPREDARRMAVGLRARAVRSVRFVRGARCRRARSRPCVHHCLAQCMELVPVEELSSAMAAHGKKVTCYIP